MPDMTFMIYGVSVVYFISEGLKLKTYVLNTVCKINLLNIYFINKWQDASDTNSPIFFVFSIKIITGLRKDTQLDKKTFFALVESNL